MIRILLVLLLFGFPYESLAAKDCICRTANSHKIKLGGYTCLKTREGLREARCVYVLNNPVWKLTGNLCPSG